MKQNIFLVFLMILVIIAMVIVARITVTDNKPEEIAEPEPNEPFDFSWLAEYDLNSDYIGKLSFESGLIELPFVSPQKDYHEYTFYTYGGDKVTDYENGCEGNVCTGNDVYLRTDWITMGYHPGGTLFMDYRNKISDQNIILYGHHYTKRLDPDRVMFFTPLEKLMEEENYEENKYLDITFKNETRRYQIAYVYIFETTSENYNNLQYYRTEYDKDYYGDPDPGYFEEYIDLLEEIKLYDTGVTLRPSDRTLTLQTCIGTDGEEIEIVVCKEIETIPYQ